MGWFLYDRDLRHARVNWIVNIDTFTLIYIFLLQTCVGVDYLICVGDCQEKIIDSLKKAIKKFYGEDPKSSESYGRIINVKHFQ